MTAIPEPEGDCFPPMALQLVWTVAAANPGVDPHAELLRAVTGEVYRQPFGSYERPDRAVAVEELLAALQSQLPRQATGEIPVVPDVVPELDERPGGDDLVHAGSLIALHRSGVLNGPRGLAHLEQALAGAVGVAWAGPTPDVAGWEECSAHVLDDLRTGRLSGLLAPEANGRLIFPDDEPAACGRCDADAAAARTDRELCPDGQCGTCWGCVRAAAEAAAS
ncbi:MAG TPA: hypothetical protein VJ931_09120 [Actinomycetota bacterium]|nr:hypothetical protein [Actinomycetota bacterium]